MSRPTVLVVDDRPQRCRTLSHGLAEFDFEVVPITRVEDAARFANAIEPWVIVTSTALLPTPGNGNPRLELPKVPDSSTFLLLGDRTLEEEHIPDGVLYLPADQLHDDELVRHVRLALLGRDLGLETDLSLEHLLADLEQTPLFDLLPALERARVSGEIELSGGSVFLHRGSVCAAKQGEATGLKAFLRLANQSEGAIRLTVRRIQVEREIDLDIDSLMTRALEESLGDTPDPETGLELRIDLHEASGVFEAYALEILRSIAGGHRTIGHLLDSLPETDGEILNQLIDLQNVGAVGFVSTRPKVAIVTDSSCDLPAKLAAQHHIQIVPLTIHFGEKSFVDGVDLKVPKFYRYLASDRPHPSTSPPTAGMFELMYKGVPQSEIFSLHISAKLSQTLANGQDAANQIAQAPELDKAFRFLDTQQVSVAQGTLGIFAARMAARGAPLEEIARRTADLASRMHLLFVVDTLDYLAKGGRIGRAQAMIGKFLGIKPILGISGGEVVAVDRARGGRKAQARLVELFAERLEPKKPVAGCIGHAQAPVWADRLRQLLTERFTLNELIVSQIGPVVGTHAGPGTVGAALVQPTDEEWRLIAPLG